MLIHRFAKSLAALGLVTVAACGSAPENARESSEAITPVCPSGACGSLRVVCATNTTCGELPKLSPGYDEPWLETKGAGGAVCSEKTALSAALVAAGCSAEFYYAPVAGVNSYEPMAMCPTLPAGTTEVACDTCTRTPPKGWMVVTWKGPFTDPCMNPGPGCHSNICLEQ